MTPLHSPGPEVRDQTAAIEPIARRLTALRHGVPLAKLEDARDEALELSRMAAALGAALRRRIAEVKLQQRAEGVRKVVG